MKSVAIITLQYVDNYGSVLQTYATQKLFESAGCDVSVVNITRENYKYHNQLKDIENSCSNRFPGLKGRILSPIIKRRWIFNYKKRHKIFELFRKNNINLTREYQNSEELFKYPPQTDIYCTGSDQVWNCSYNGGILSEYFLSFAPKGKKRVAFSASFGKTEYSADEISTMKELLLQYDAISVREKSASSFLSSIGIQDVVHVLDPTLAFDANKWRSYIYLSDNIKKKYILVYQLNDNEDMIHFAEGVAADNDYELVMVTRSYKARFSKGRVISDPTVEQFLSLISYAQFVVTDSFHGTAFSLNFNKQFFIFYPPRFSTRLESILELTNTKHRLVDTDKTRWNEIDEIDYDNVNQILNNERNKINEFISSVVSYE